MQGRRWGKLRRARRACDFCHQRAIKCRPSLTGVNDVSLAASSVSCATCIDHGVPCTRLRPELKRGKKTEGQDSQRVPALEAGVITADWNLSEDVHGSKATLEALIDVYFDTVYPMSGNVPSRENRCLMPRQISFPRRG